MDVGFGLGKGSRARRVHPGWRVAEGLGLICVITAMASERWLLAIAGGLGIVVTYALYRRRHPACLDEDNSGADGDDSDPGGGD